MYLLQCLLRFLCFFTTRAPHAVEGSALHGPEAEYGRRLVKHAEQLQKFRKRHQLLWISFLASAIATTGAAASAVWLQVPWSWLWCPAALLGWSLHSLTLNAKRCKELYAVVRFYECGLRPLAFPLARTRHHWRGTPSGRACLRCRSRPLRRRFALRDAVHRAYRNRARYSGELAFASRVARRD